MVKYLLGPVNRGHGASKVLASFAAEYNLEYVTFYSYRGISIWLKSLLSRRVVIYAPAISRINGVKKPGYLRDIFFILTSYVFFPFKNHPIYFINSQIDFKSKIVSPLLYKLIRNRIIIGPSKPIHVVGREILYYYSNDMIVNTEIEVRDHKDIIVWHLGYKLKEKGWNEFKQLSNISPLEFKYCGRDNLQDFPNIITNEIPAEFVANLFFKSINVFLFLSKSDLFPLVVLEAISNGFVIATVKNSVSESILNGMFRGRKCYLVLERIEELNKELIVSMMPDIITELAHFNKLQLLSRKYG